MQSCKDMKSNPFYLTLIFKNEGEIAERRKRESVWSEGIFMSQHLYLLFDNIFHMEPCTSFVHVSVSIQFQ